MITNGLNIFEKRVFEPYYEEKGKFVQNLLFGTPKTKFSRKTPTPPPPSEIGGIRYGILLSNEIVQDISERNVCTKFGESW